MDPDNSPSLRNKRLRDEPDNVEAEAADDEPSGNENDDGGEDSGGETGAESGESLAETPAAHGRPGMTLARATELEELVLQSRALCGASGAGCASEPKEVVVHYGPTGTGKTRYCYEQFPDAYMFANAQEARRDTVVSRFILGYRAGPPTLIPDSDNERRFFIRDEAGAVRALDLGAGRRGAFGRGGRRGGRGRAQPGRHGGGGGVGRAWGWWAGGRRSCTTWRSAPIRSTTLIIRGRMSFFGLQQFLILG